MGGCLEVNHLSLQQVPHMEVMNVGLLYVCCWTRLDLAFVEMKYK